MQLQLYSRTHEAWQAMYQDCLMAKISIEFEQYIIRNDEIGRNFLNLFAEKARQGVRIHLLFDRVGSRKIFSSPIINNIRESGGRVVFYNPIGWINLLAPMTWFPRNHVKALLIDSSVAHIGSACLADYMKDWRDIHARVTGDPVGEIEKEFSYTWARANRGIDSISKGITADGDFRYLVARPLLFPNPIYRELLFEISRAQHNIYLATPYFMPPLRLRMALKNAVRRGVKVHVIVTEKTDVPLAVHVSRSYFPTFIRNGIRIFSYKETVFHEKYAIVDDQWAMLGSTNIDYLSLVRNRESNLLIRDEDTIEYLRQHFIRDRESCEELHADFWKKLPLPSRIIGYLGRFLKKMI